MQQAQAHDLEGLHQDVADDEDVVEGGGGGVEAGAERAGAEVRCGGVVVRLVVVQGERGEDGQEGEGGPDGEGDEDGVDEAGCWDWRGEGGVRALDGCGVSLAVCSVRREVCEGCVGEEGDGRDVRSLPGGLYKASSRRFISSPLLYWDCRRDDDRAKGFQL